MSVPLSKVASVEKSAVLPSGTLLVLLCRMELVQKKIRGNGIFKLSARIFDTKIWRAVMARAL